MDCNIVFYYIYNCVYIYIPIRAYVIMISAKDVALISLSLLELLLFGGMQFGWFALVFILKQEDVFESFCVSGQHNNSTGDTSTTKDCFPQDEQFNLIFSIGIAIFTIFSAINGQLYQTFDIKPCHELAMSFVHREIYEIRRRANEIG